MRQREVKNRIMILHSTKCSRNITLNFKRKKPESLANMHKKTNLDNNNSRTWWCSLEVQANRRTGNSMMVHKCQCMVVQKDMTT